MFTASAIAIKLKNTALISKSRNSDRKIVVKLKKKEKHFIGKML